jgi:hypothetical protein
LANRGTANDTGTSMSKKRIRHGTGQIRGTQQRRVERVDVEVRCIQAQVGRAGADITGFDGDAEGQFALHVNRELLNPGRLGFGIDQRETLADGG